MNKLLAKIKKLLLLLSQLPTVIWLNFIKIPLARGKKMIILVETTSTNEFFYLKSVLLNLHNHGQIIIFMSDERLESPVKQLINKNFKHPVPAYVNSFWVNLFSYLDFYINATLAYNINVPSKAKYKINFAHSITSKTKYDIFSPAIEKITDLFLTGNVYSQDLESYYQANQVNRKPRLHKVGSPKSDDLFNHQINKPEFIKNIGLDPNLPVVFYAPTWNPGGSIFSWLEEVLQIPEKHNVNLIVKVHPGAYIDPIRKKISGGVDWKAFFEDPRLQSKRIFNAMNVDSTDFILASDIGITDISTTWIEFYLRRKNIIFLDIPEFFKDHQMNSLGDIRNTYGHLVANPELMNEMIENMLSNKNFKKKDPPPLDDELLYNKGQATQTALEVINSLYKTI